MIEEIERLTKALEAAERTEQYLRDDCDKQIANARADRAIAEARVSELETELEAEFNLGVERLKRIAIAEEHKQEAERSERERFKLWLDADARVKELEAILAADTPEALEKLQGFLADKRLCVVKFVDVLDMNECRSAWQAAKRETGQWRAACEKADTKLTNLRERVDRAVRMLSGPHSVVAVVEVLRGH